MTRFGRLLLAFLCLARLARCEDLLAAEAERLRNTPPELSPTDPSDQAQARFLPFSASFSVSAGGAGSQSFSIASGPDGIGLSQSASHADGSNGNPGSFSASQSSSIAAGLNGISAANSNAVAANHPVLGPTSQANSNSFALGQANAASHGDVVNGQAVSGAQSSVGASHSQASSSAAAQSHSLHRPERPAGWTNAQPIHATGHNGDYNLRPYGTPTLTIEVNDDHHQGKRPTNGGWYDVPDDRDSRDDWKPPHFCKHSNDWYRDPRCRAPWVKVTKPGVNIRPYFENSRDPRQERPSITISKPGPSVHPRPGGPSFGLSQAQAQSQSHQGGRRPSPSITINRVETSGNAQANAQGSASTIHLQNGGLQPHIVTGSASASSRPGGSAQASSSASAGGSHVQFPGPSSDTQIIPKEFIRSKKPKDGEGPIESLIDEVADAVYDALEY